MIFINNDNFMLENSGNYYDRLKDIPKTRCPTDYDVKLVSADPVGFNYTNFNDVVYKVQHDGDDRCLYGTITIDNSNSNNKCRVSRGNSFVGEKITMNFDLNDHYYVEGFEFSAKNLANRK